jgi:ATP-binding protein involved in chromosome partitioning
VPLLGEIPLDPEARRCGDEGKPVVLAQCDSPSAKVFADFANQVTKILFPSISS